MKIQRTPGFSVNGIKLEDFVDPVDNRGGNKFNFPIKMGP